MLPHVIMSIIGFVLLLIGMLILVVASIIALVAGKNEEKGLGGGGLALIIIILPTFGKYSFHSENKTEFFFRKKIV